MKQKRDKIINEKSEGSKILIGIIAFALFFGIIIVSALTTEEALQNEFNSLGNELSNNVHRWLDSIEVFIKLNLSIKGDLSL